MPITSDTLIDWMLGVQDGLSSGTTGFRVCVGEIPASEWFDLQVDAEVRARDLAEELAESFNRLIEED